VRKDSSGWVSSPGKKKIGATLISHISCRGETFQQRHTSHFISVQLEEKKRGGGVGGELPEESLKFSA